MNNEIKSWLESEKDFETGVQLYSRFGQSQNLKRILERSEVCQEHLDTLTYELGQLLDAPADYEKIRSTRLLFASNRTLLNDQENLASTLVSMPPDAALYAHQQIRGSTPYDVSLSGPLDIQSVVENGRFSKEDEYLFQTIKEKLKLRDHLHATLELVPKDQCKNNALMILELSDQITEDYQRHDHFKKHGVLPPEKIIELKKPDKPVIDLSQAELEKRKLNIRTKISVYKNKIKDPALESRLNYNKAMLIHWERKLHETLNLLS